MMDSFAINALRQNEKSKLSGAENRRLAVTDQAKQGRRVVQPPLNQMGNQRATLQSPVSSLHFPAYRLRPNQREMGW